MVSPLEEYFNSLDFSPDSSQGEYTAAEKLFMQKYLGVKEEDLPGGKAKAKPAPTEAAEAAPAPAGPGDAGLDTGLDYIENTSFEPDTDAAETDSPAFIEKAVEVEESQPEAVAVAATEPEQQETVETKPEPAIEAAAVETSVEESSPAPAEVPAEPEAQAEPETKEEVQAASPAPEPAQPATPAPEPAVQPAVQAEPAPASAEPAPAAALVAENDPATQAVRAEYEEVKQKEPSLEEILKQEERCQMVAFFIGDQEFVVPTMAMQEVIRFEEPIKIPMAPEFVEGVITLRGRVTPVVNLRDMLAVTNKPLESGKCIIICTRRGIQLGFVVEKIHTMYWVPQKDLEWAVEAQLGINADVDFISAVMKSEDGEMLMGMLSVDKIIDYILR